MPDDYLPVGDDVLVSPIHALIFASQGGSKEAAIVQVEYIKTLSQALSGFTINDIQEGINQVKTERFLQRELDPEKS